MKNRHCSSCNSDKYYCKGLCKSCYRKFHISPSWSKKYAMCVGCNSTSSPHVAHGLCNKCYSTQTTERECACGCGTPVTRRGSHVKQFAKGHWIRVGNNNELVRKDMSGTNNPQFGKFGKSHPAYGHATSEKTREERRVRRLNTLSNRGKVTNIERILSDILDGLGVVHIPQTTLYGKFSVDEFVPQYNLVIEAYGGYWHGDQRRFPNLSQLQLKTTAKDRSKEKYLNTCGHRVLILWENELLHFPDWCISEIQLAIREYLVPLTQDSVQGES